MSIARILTTCRRAYRNIEYSIEFIIAAVPRCPEHTVTRVHAAPGTHAMHESLGRIQCEHSAARNS